MKVHMEYLEAGGEAGVGVCLFEEETFEINNTKK